MIEGIAEFIFALGDILEVFLGLKSKTTDYKTRLEKGELIKATATIMGSLKAKTKGEFLILNFSLLDGTVVQEKSMHITNLNFKPGEIVEIAYNPKDLKEIYLLD
jgi:hypothetical protein